MIGYEDRTRHHGWPVGAALSGAAPFLKIVALTVMVLAVWKAWYLYAWSAFSIVLIGGVSPQVSRWSDIAALSFAVALLFLIGLVLAPMFGVQVPPTPVNARHSRSSAGFWGGIWIFGRDGKG